MDDLVVVSGKRFSVKGFRVMPHHITRILEVASREMPCRTIEIASVGARVRRFQLGHSIREARELSPGELWGSDMISSSRIKERSKEIMMLIATLTLIDGHPGVTTAQILHHIFPQHEEHRFRVARDGEWWHHTPRDEHTMDRMMSGATQVNPHRMSLHYIRRHLSHLEEGGFVHRPKSGLYAPTDHWIARDVEIKR